MRDFAIYVSSCSVMMCGHDFVSVFCQVFYMCFSFSCIYLAGMNVYGLNVDMSRCSLKKEVKVLGNIATCKPVSALSKCLFV